MSLLLTARVMQIHTQGDKRDYITWMTVDKQERDYIIFRIKAVSDAHILLTETINDFSIGYEVIIGGWDNTQSGIRQPPYGDLVHEVPTEGLLSKDEWRTFWISYDHGLVEAGSGTDVGANIILQWHADSPLTINAITVSTAVNILADWEFSQFEGTSIVCCNIINISLSLTYIPLFSYIRILFLGNTYRIKSPRDTHTFSNSLAMKKPYFLFRVRACQEVYIELLATPGMQSSMSYYMVFGASDNTRGILYKMIDGQEQEIYSNNRDNFLTCDTLKLFWVALDNQGEQGLRIEAGQGRTIYEDWIIQYTDMSPLTVRAVSLASSRNEKGTANWEFSGDAGNKVIGHFHCRHHISSRSRGRGRGRSSIFRE